MPREAVYGQDPVLEMDQHGGITDEDYENERSIVEVRWNRDAEYVQVVSRLKGYEIMPTSDVTYGYKYGMHVTLGRNEINQLIRNLRRARDQAFGRDE